jgi:hypothetical protein
MQSAEMPKKSRTWLEKECLRRFGESPSTLSIKRIGLTRLLPEGSDPNWGMIELEPPPSPLGYDKAREIVAALAGEYALDNDT